MSNKLTFLIFSIFTHSDPCNYNINVTQLWAENVTGRLIVVTVVDDGLEHLHLDIVGNYDAEGSHDYIDNDDDPTPKYTNDNINKHGTRYPHVVYLFFSQIDIAFPSPQFILSVLNKKPIHLLEFLFFEELLNIKRYSYFQVRRTDRINGQ